MPVTSLGLSVHALNCLHNYKLSTVGDVQAKTDRELLRMNHLGVVTLREIREAVARASGDRAVAPRRALSSDVIGPVAAKEFTP